MVYSFPLLHHPEDQVVIILTKKLLCSMWFLKIALPIQPFQFCDSNGIYHLLHHTPLILVVWIGLGIVPTLGEKEPPLSCMHRVLSGRMEEASRMHEGRACLPSVPPVSLALHPCWVSE